MSFINKCFQILGELDEFICKGHCDFGILLQKKTFFSKVEPMELNAVAYLSIFRLSGSDDNSDSCRALSELSDPSRDRDQ